MRFRNQKWENFLKCIYHCRKNMSTNFWAHYLKSGKLFLTGRLKGHHKIFIIEDRLYRIIFKAGAFYAFSLFITAIWHVHIVVWGSILILVFRWRLPIAHRKIINFTLTMSQLDTFWLCTQRRGIFWVSRVIKGGGIKRFLLFGFFAAFWLLGLSVIYS